jgi:hypothetical protein
MEPDRIIVHPNQRATIEAHYGMINVEQYLQDQFLMQIWPVVPNLPSRWHPIKRSRAIKAHKQMLADHIMVQWFGEARH